MEKILPVAGATGFHSFAPTEANPSLANDQDSTDYTLTLDNMDVDAVSHPTSESVSRLSPAIAAVSVSTTPSAAITSTAASSSQATATPSADISLQPATKRQRLADDIPDNKKTLKSKSSGALSIPSRTESRKSNVKGKGKARTSSDHSSIHSGSLSAQTPSTLQRVNKITPAVALVELHGSIKDMTQAILVASKPPESTDDKAMTRCQEAMRLVQECDDGLSVMEQAQLIVFFGDHNKEVEMCIALEDDQLRREVNKQWIGNL